MVATVVSLLLASMASAAAGVELQGIENGTLLTYKGTMIADKGEVFLSRKTIEISFLVSDVDADGMTLWWTKSEDGRGQWPWPGRFGQLRLNANYKPAGTEVPALLYLRDNGQNIVSLEPPFLAGPQPLSQDLKWEEGRKKFHVTGQSTKEGRQTWRVEATTPYGRNRTAWVETQSPLVVSLKRTLFIGQGEKYQLKLKLTDKRQLSPQQFAAMLDGYKVFVNLRRRLGYELRNISIQWNDLQLAMLRGELPDVVALTKRGPLFEVVKAAIEDAKDQKNRSGAVSALRRRAMGKSLDQLRLEGISGETVALGDLRNHVVVLHLWQYQNKPLEEPYGQIGYLDYLYRQRKGDGLKVIGVVVNQRMNDPSTRVRAISSAKKLKSFMNLSYPLMFDDGLIEKLGDPRMTGAKLPLYVILDTDGKVIEYHSGLYEVSRDRGLEQLDALITKALGNRE